MSGSSVEGNKENQLNSVRQDPSIGILGGTREASRGGSQIWEI